MSKGRGYVTPESNANGRGEPLRGAAPSRRQLFALAAVLAATVLTAGAAIAGLTRAPGSPPASTPTVDQIVNPAPPMRVEPGD